MIYERRYGMDELIKLVTQKAGITDEQARIAIDTGVGFLKQKLPPRLQVRSMVF